MKTLEAGLIPKDGVRKGRRRLRPWTTNRPVSMETLVSKSSGYDSTDGWEDGIY